MQIIMENEIVFGVSSFTTGVVRTKCTQTPVPLTEEQVIDWAAKFEACGYHRTAEELIDKFCNGRPVYRSL